MKRVNPFFSLCALCVLCVLCVFAVSPVGRVHWREAMVVEGVRPVVLVIMDGWGDAPPGPGNAVTLAATPTYRPPLRHRRTE